MKLDRELIVGTYITGSGIGLGGCHKPLEVPASANVRYAERLADSPSPELELTEKPAADHLADRDLLENTAPASQDFVIATHVLEHSQDPIGTLLAMLKLVKPGGVLFLEIRDSGGCVSGTASESEVEQVEALSPSDRSPAVPPLEVLESLLSLRGTQPFEIDLFFRQDDGEVITVLRKSDSTAPQSFSAILNSVSTPEPWCIDDLSYDGEQFEIRGWALAPYGRHELIKFTVNDKDFEETQFPIARPDIEQVFWYKPGADRSAFCCRSKLKKGELFMDKYATLKCVNRTSGLPIREEYNFYFPDDDSGPELPEPERQRRVFNTENPDLFRLEGFGTFKKLDLALQKTTNRTLGDFRNVLDWGCGCGRVTRYFNSLPGSRVVGVDVDSDNVNWCREHISFGEFCTIGLHPPTKFEDERFDLIFGISVFSHLRERDQDDWLAELSRIAKPGAVLLMSVVGESAVGRDRWGQASWNQWHETGFLVAGDKSNLNDFLDDHDYYVTAYITEDYVRRNWSRFFEILEIIPAYITNHQDLVVMRKPG